MIFDNKIIAVTGGTGSWGNELVSQLLSIHNPKEIRVFSRGEHKQVDMHRKFNDSRLKFIIGDVRDKIRLSQCFQNVDYVFHLAALKHVPVCEENGWEAVLTNVYGTQNVIEVAKMSGVSVVVDVSTDKAVDPFNLYGVTKALGEKLIANSNLPENKTKYVCIRGGNVIGTNGSVLPLFKKQILEKNEITITEPTMTRYLMSLQEAIALVFKATELALGGEVFVMKMPATKVETIADTMIKVFGDKKTKKTIIGIRPGEKIHEVLVSKNESPRTVELNNDYFVILPFNASDTLKKHYSKYPAMTRLEFSSDNADQIDGPKLENIILNLKDSL